MGPVDRRRPLLRGLKKTRKAVAGRQLPKAPKGVFMKGDDCAALITKVSQSFKHIMCIMDEWNLPVRKLRENTRLAAHHVQEATDIDILHILRHEVDKCSSTCG